jgi:hypothetical protein
MFSLVYYGGGGFTYNDVYHMPTLHRKFQLNKLVETKKSENKHASQQSIPKPIGTHFKKK